MPYNYHTGLIYDPIGQVCAIAKDEQTAAKLVELLNYVEDSPTAHCASCDKQEYTHKMHTVLDYLYCEDCYKRKFTFE